MSEGRAFVDTNVFVYLFSEDERLKQQRSIQILNAYDCWISTQVVNEFCSICTRKWKMPTHDIQRAVDKICLCGTLYTVDLPTVRHALELCERYHYSYYDSLILASALACDCEYLLTEDLNDGQIIENSLTIRNIYKF